MSCLLSPIQMISVQTEYFPYREIDDKLQIGRVSFVDKQYCSKMSEYICFLFNRDSSRRFGKWDLRKRIHPR